MPGQNVTIFHPRSDQGKCGKKFKFAKFYRRIFIAGVNGDGIGSRMLITPHLTMSKSLVQLQSPIRVDASVTDKFVIPGISLRTRVGSNILLLTRFSLFHTMLISLCQNFKILNRIFVIKKIRKRK